jgi:uncharacterized protein YbjT (DUF2867 family)
MLLVTGPTGTIGRPLIDILINEGAKVRAVTHGPQAANLPAEVEVVQGDLGRPAAIAPFLKGVTGLFLYPRAVGQAAGELLRLARQRGVQRVVAARALRTDELVGQRPVLTGPQSLTHWQLVATIGEVLGRPLRYHELPPEAATQGMLADHAAAFRYQQPAGSNR